MKTNKTTPKLKTFADYRYSKSLIVCLPDGLLFYYILAIYQLVCLHLILFAIVPHE